MRIKLKRPLCMFLCIAILFGIFYIPIAAVTDALSEAAVISDASSLNDGRESVTTTETFIEDGIKYNIERTTQYIGTRTYGMEIKVRSAVESTDSPEQIYAAKNGYFTVTKEGYYLLELWGGDGGNGTDNTETFLTDTKYFPGGVGGAGGYVYAKVWLEPGQTLVYTIGTDGGQAAAGDEEAGGENGEGGIHGPVGSRLVGGGGGFSALYFFDVGEFKESWITTAGIEIPETARLSKYILIAGGGGGGGAGAGATPYSVDEFAPNGGAGGNIANGVSVTLDGGAHAVSGYIFSGRRGSSSYTSTEYVGRGGTSIPAAIVTTDLNLVVDSTTPNDWTGKYNPTLPFGTGGSGNLRGGGGGAGYCGGSGGNMQGLLFPVNVGGGGGGSSFIADHITYAGENGELVTKELVFEISADDEANEYIRDVNASTVGGACEITYLGVDDEPLRTEVFKSVTVKTEISKYFTVHRTSSSSSGTLSYTQNSATGGTTVTATGLDITPSSANVEQREANVKLVIVAHTEFVGGNSVELVSSVVASLKDPHGEAKDVVLTSEENDTHDFVNVPVRFDLETKSYTTSVTPKTYNKTEFYTDSYVSIRNNLASLWQYDYIASIGEYSVWNAETEITSSISVSETTVLSVKYSVGLKTVETDSPVTVGPINSNPYVKSKNAVISIVSTKTAELNDVIVTASKALEYNGGNYILKLNLEQQTKNIVFPHSTQVKKTSGSGSYEVPTSGWYYIQAWGANGQWSGDASVRAYRNVNTVKAKGKGVAGGAGGYVFGYIYLEAGTSIDYLVGAAPSAAPAERYNQLDSATGDADFQAGTGGDGGNYTSVMIDGNTYIIAGGGGGAGGSAAAATTGTASDEADGVTPSQNTTITDSSTLFSGNLDDYNGSDGNDGWGEASYSFWGSTVEANSGTAGRGGANYRYQPLSTGYDYVGRGVALSDEALKYAATKITAKSSGTVGQVSITLLESDTAMAEKDKLTSIDASVAISQYFDVVGVSLSATGGSMSHTVTPVTLSNGNSVSVVSVAMSYTSTIETGTDNGTEIIRYKASPTLVIKLKTKDGFLGGNDVPVLVSGYLGGSNVDSQNLTESGLRVTKASDFMHPPEVVTTDYANVALDFDFESGGVDSQMFTVNNKTITLGEQLSESDLYTFYEPEFSGNNAWRADFVKFVQPTTDGDAVIAPTKTTEYPLSVKLTPKADALNAIIVDSIEDIEYELVATVYVNVSVTYNLHNVTSDGDSLIPHGKAYSFMLSAENGYVLPVAIEIYHRISDTEKAEITSGVTYNSQSGEVSMAADVVKNNLEIVAVAEKQTFSINIAYATDPAGNDVRTVVHGVKYEAGASIDIDAIIAEEGIAGSQIPGYTYTWTYDTVDGSKPETMPANDLWIYGAYQKNTYKFSIHYVYEDGTAVSESVEVIVQYGDSYSVASPAKKGYKADQPIVSGVQSTEANDITVVYTPSSNEVTILLLKKDGTKAHEPIVDSLSTGEIKTYNILADYSLNGYTPDNASVTVTMEGESQTLIVYYTPNRHTVSFEYAYGVGKYPEYPNSDFSSATLDFADTKLVEYDNEYSFDAQSGIFSGLPMPEIAGYTFAGWYLDKDFNNRIIDSDKVSVDSDHTLYAKWTPTPFKLVITYEFIYTENDFLPEEYESAEVIRAELSATQLIYDIPYGSSYYIPLNQYTGYSSYVNFGFVEQSKVTALEDTMPATTVSIVVTYEINSYTVTFKDLPGAYIDYSDWNGEGAKPDSVAADAHDTQWATVVVKHDASPEYPLGKEDSDGYVAVEPYHSTKSTYTYAFKGWMSSDGNTYYDGVTPDNFPTAWGDVTYYTSFGATENIISLTQNSVTTYYVTVAEAIAAMEAGFPGATSATLAFRRNSHNGTEIVLNGDTLTFGQGYVGTTLCTVTVNLMGYSVKTTNGETVIKNTDADDAIALVITDTASQKGGIYASGSGDVVAVDCDNRGLTFSAAIAVSAVSESGNATAIKFGANTSSVNMSFGAAPTITATANNGAAIGIHLFDTEFTCSVYSTSSSASYSPIINVTGKDAYGAYADSLGYLGSSSYYFITNMTVNGTNSAYGIYNVPTSRICWLSTIDVTASGNDATAIGIVGTSSLTFVSSGSSTAEVRVKAPLGNAYGLIVTKSLNTSPALYTVIGKNAVGVEIRDGATFTVSSNYNVYDVKGSETAIGVNVLEGATLARSSTYYINATVVATAGTAIGVKNAGTVSALTATVNATATGGNAYGIYNLGGSIAASGITSSMNINATSTDADGYGLYSEGGEVGTESSAINAGSFAGSSYGIYCTDGSIYVSGNYLYFKGADKDSALYENTAEEGENANGVIILAGYSQAAANAGDPWSGAVGYYRLGRTWTITFVTNGGTEIESVTQIYDTPLDPVITSKRGYDFVEWNTDEELMVSYTYPSYMPDSDLTLYAEWDIIEYVYTYDTNQFYLNVTFDTNYTATTGQTDKTVTLVLDEALINKDSDYITEMDAAWIFDDLTYKYSTYLYVFTGWYSTETRTDSSYVPLNGDLGVYDTDADGYLNLYAGWQRLSGCGIYAPFGTTEGSASFGATYTSSSNCCYLYYVVPADGDYTVTYDNYHASSTVSATRKYRYLAKYTNQATTGTVVEDTVSNSSYYANTTVAHNYTKTFSDAKAGEVIIVRWYSRGSGSTYTTTKVAAMVASTTADISSVGNYAINSPTVYKELFTYTVADGENGDGIVELLVPERLGYQFLGWSHLVETNDKGEMIIKLTPELVVRYDAWINREVLDLYSQWDEITWEAQGAVGRLPQLAPDWVTPPDISINDNETITLNFFTEYDVIASAIFTFKNGLTAGTILTLIDRSGEFPTYYTYTVEEDGVKELAADQFTLMGDVSESFSGVTTNVVLQICYKNADVTTVTETVGIVTTDLTPEITINYQIIDSAVKEIVAEDEAVFDYLTEHNADVVLSGLSIQGLDPTDRVYIIISWNELYIAPGATLKLVYAAEDGTETEIVADVYSGSYAKFNTGLTAADLASADEIVYTLKYTLSTMQYNEFTSKDFICEAYAVPAKYDGSKTLFASDIKPICRIVETVTLTETPGIIVPNTSTHYVTGGEELIIEKIALDDSTIPLSLMVYQLTDSGFEVTEFAKLLLEEAADGVSDALELTNGNLVLHVTSFAESGRYYLKLIYGDKYVYVPVKVKVTT